MKKIRILAFGILMTASAATFAQSTGSDQGIYLGLEGGIGNMDVDLDANSAVLSEKSNLGVVRAAIGYRFDRNFAVEAGYFHTGDYELKEQVARNHDDQFSAHAKGFDLSVIYRLTHFLPGVFVKGGVMHSTVSGRMDEIYRGRVLQSHSFSRSGGGYLVGLGYELDLSRALGLTAGYTRQQGLGGESRINLNLFAAGLRYRF